MVPSLIFEENIMQPIRQGDVLLSPSSNFFYRLKCRKLSHLTLAHGEVTGHSHRITEGEAELYQENDTLYLEVLSKTATLTHEEHKEIEIPQGTWIIRIQREYQINGFRYVSD
jgi:hypothetical protein